MFFSVELYVKMINVKMDKVIGTVTEVGGYICCHLH